MIARGVILVTAAVRGENNQGASTKHSRSSFQPKKQQRPLTLNGLRSSHLLSDQSFVAHLPECLGKSLLVGWDKWVA
jgi:hypothetical protein